MNTTNTERRKKTTNKIKKDYNLNNKYITLEVNYER